MLGKTIVIFQRGRFRSGAREERRGVQPLRQVTLAPWGEKLTIGRKLFTDDNTFVNCTNWESLLLVKLKKITDSLLLTSNLKVNFLCQL